MITVRDLLKARWLADARCIFDNEMGYDNAVVGIGLLDYEPLLDRYHTFAANEIVVTSLGFSGGDIDLATKALVCQMDSGIAGIFIKEMLFDHVSDEVAQRAQETNTPIFFFREAYVEDIVTELRNIFYDEEADEKRRAIIDELRKLRSAADIRSFVRESTGLASSCVGCVALRPLVSLDPLSMRAVASALADVVEHEEGLAYFLSCYEDGWVLLVGCDSATANQEQQMLALAQKLSRNAGAALACGLGGVVLFEEVDLTLAQALQASRSVQARQSFCWWRDLGWEAFRGAALESPLVAQQCAYLRGILAEYDAQNNSELLETVRAFVRCGGVVQQTAEELYVHPNSVRNRIVRAARLLGRDDEPERLLFAFFAVMVLDESLLPDDGNDAGARLVRYGASGRRCLPCGRWSGL